MGYKKMTLKIENAIFRCYIIAKQLYKLFAKYKGGMIQYGCIRWNIRKLDTNQR